MRRHTAPVIRPILGIAFAAILLSLTMGGVAHADVIAERKAGFRGNAAALKQIQAALPASDFDSMSDAAMNVAGWSARMLDYFPEGSGRGNTDARPEIWSNFDDFTRHAKDAEEAALHLARLAKAGEAAMLTDGFGKLAATCKACHARYKK